MTEEMEALKERLENGTQDWEGWKARDVFELGVQFGKAQSEEADG